MNDGEKYLITSCINKDLMGFKKYYGNAIVYEEIDIIETMTNDNIKMAIDQLDSLIKSDVIHFLQIERTLYVNTKIVNFFQDIFDIYYHPKIKDYVYEIVKDGQSTLTEAYQLAHKINLNKKFKEYYQLDKSIDKKRYLGFNAKIDKLIEKHVYRIMFEIVTKDRVTDFIWVTSHLNSSLFYESHPNLVGVIVTSSKNQQWYEIFAINYQIPIVVSNHKFNNNSNLIIDLDDRTIYVNPNDDKIEESKNPKSLFGCSYEIYNPIQKSNISLYGMIANYKDAYYGLNPLFSKGIVYATDFSIFAKGVSLTINEWMHRFHHIFKTYTGESIIVRLPLMHEHIRTQEFTHRIDFEMLYLNPAYFESIVYAAAITHQKFPEKKLSFMIPNIESYQDYQNWTFHITEMYREIEKKLSISFVSSLDTMQGILEQPGMLSIDNQVINLDYACEDYYSPFFLGTSSLDIRTLRDGHLYRDLTYNKEQFVSNRSKSTFMIMGHYLTLPDIFHRILVGGYRHIIVPMHLPHAMVDELSSRISTRGNHIGIYHLNRIRTTIYRMIKEKYNLGPGNTRRSLKARQLFEEFIKNIDNELKLSEQDKEYIIKLLEKDLKDDDDEEKKN